MVSFFFILDNFLPTRTATASIQCTQEGELSHIFLSLTGPKKSQNSKALFMDAVPMLLRLI